MWAIRIASDPGAAGPSFVCLVLEGLRAAWTVRAGAAEQRVRESDQVSARDSDPPTAVAAVRQPGDSVLAHARRTRALLKAVRPTACDRSVLSAARRSVPS